MTTPPPAATAGMDAMHGHGIHTIDTRYVQPRFCAAYLVVENGRGAFVDCGTARSLPHMLAALDAAGLAPPDVDWLVLTHVHLDHAGGAGALMQRLPNARLLAHPRAAPHMIDPTRLVAGATAVYGEAEFDSHYGAIVPVDAARVVVADDGHVAELAGRPLLCIDTPGHARHHMCIWDARSRTWFTGDAFGLSYRELDTARGPFALPTSSPVQFEPEAMKASIARMLAFEPDAMHVTHFGRVDQPARMARDLCATIDAMVAIVRAERDAGDRHARVVSALEADYLARLRAHGCTQADGDLLDLLRTDIELNAQGLEIWVDRRARAA
jgi:glyoxylase-like metal-dependent hydrolase (beta-lactamase superfamily II)